MSEVRSPTVRRRELGALLRKLRTEKGLTVEQAADRLLFSMSKLSRMETGHGVATLRDIRDLCDLYGVTDEAERREARPPRPSPAARPKANDADISHSSATPQEIPPNNSTPVPARPHPARPSYARRLSCHRRLCLCVPLGTMLISAPSHHNPMGTCPSNNSMNVALYLIDSVERHIH